MVRPSYVLGGRAMEIVYSDADIHRYITTAVEVDPERPVLVDKYLDRADELDVDALSGERALWRRRRRRLAGWAARLPAGQLCHRPSCPCPCPALICFPRHPAVQTRTETW